MYKVFVNDKPIILVSSLQKDENYPVYIFKSTAIEEILYKLKVGKLSGVYLLSFDLENDWISFKKEFKVIKAGGGLVLNSKKEVLFIFRGNKWDLPKGRVEKGESIEEASVREVEEECGIKNIILDRFLLTTYHVFYKEKEARLKETDWFLMYSDYKGTLTPQLEEGITEVVFKNKEEIIKALENSYLNIAMVCDSLDDEKDL